MKIIPAILPLRYYDIPEGIEKILGAVDTVQIDFVDGHFASNRTWWFNNKNADRLADLLSQNEGLPHWESMNYEFDLMIKDPIAIIDTILALGPSRIIFHVEGLDQAKTLEYFETMPEIVRSTISFGMAIGVGTDPESIRPYTEYIDTVQCMAIANVGFQGQAFDERVIAQVQKIKELYPDKTIAVDGAMNEETIPKVAQAGATVFVVGSAVFQSATIHGTIQRLQWLAENSQQEN